MVNHETIPDQRDFAILDALRAAKAPISGQALANQLGISRVALWKRIENLKGWSYGITATKKGYLLREDDAVAAWEFPEDIPVIYRPEIASTMDEAWRLAENGAQSGTIIIADRQRAGRGRLDRNWISPEGGIYLTLILRCSIPASHVACIALEGATTIVEWLEEEHDCKLDFHWPNDLMADGRKVGGILVEMAGSPEAPRFYTVGLGINFHEAGVLDRPSAGLTDLTDHAPLRRDLAMAFRERLCTWAATPQLEPERWETHCSLLGQQVLLRDWRGRETLGTARGFDEHGAFRIEETGTGFDKSFIAGETTLVRLHHKNSGVSS